MSLVVYSRDREITVGERQVVVYNQAYFEYLQDQDPFGGYDSFNQSKSNRRSFSIPDDIFVQGYYKRFFRQVALLGNGSRAVVYKVKHILLDNELGTFALKKICIGDDIHWLYRCLKEVKLLNRLTEDSSHLITYNHVWLEKCPTESLILTEGVDSVRSDSAINIPSTMPYMFILQQFCCGGNLEDVVQYKVFERISGDDSRAERKRKMLNKSEKGLHTSQICSIARDLATGLRQLHSLRIIHRDLKPSNCLLLEEFDRQDTNSFPKCVIGDFGESQLYGQLRDATGSTGTLEFVAPELIKGAQFSFKSDIYALGMILYFVIVGQLPFDSKEMSTIRTEIDSLVVTPDSMVKTHKELGLKSVDVRLFDLICEMLNHDPLLRPDLKNIMFQLDSLNVNSKLAQKQDNPRTYFAELYAILVAILLTVLNHSHWLWWKYTLLFVTGFFHSLREKGNTNLIVITTICTVISLTSVLI